MKWEMKKHTLLQLVLILFLANDPQLHSQKNKTTLNDHSGQITYKRLEHYYSDSRTDNLSTSNPNFKSGSLSANYRLVRTDGYILDEASNLEGKAVPLYLYYSDVRKDHFTTATPEGIRDAEGAGYRKVGVEGYVLKSVSPKYEHLYSPLWLYYHGTRMDNFTIATPNGARAAKRAGYRAVRIEGYIRIEKPANLVPIDKAPEGNEVFDESLHLSELKPIKKINYIRQYPADQDNNWSDNLQGVTHDANNWYFTQLTKLWKFPFSHDLAKKLNGPNPSQNIYQINIPKELSELGYNHFSDLDFFDGYLFVPIEAPETSVTKFTRTFPFISTFITKPRPLILVYDADDLQYIGNFELEKQSNAGWCAIHPITKELYTSNTHIDPNSSDQKIFRYFLDFDRLKKEGEVVLKFINYFELYNESGNTKLNIKKHMQGGDFSEDGHYLFLVNGTNKASRERDGGVWVFDSKTGRKFTKSFSTRSDFGTFNNTKTYINEDFRYQYDAGGTTQEEPEGITVGNVDGKGDTSIKGQLHVILLDNNLVADDGVYFKHYQIVK